MPWSARYAMGEPCPKALPDNTEGHEHRRDEHGNETREEKDVGYLFIILCPFVPGSHGEERKNAAGHK
jgi:hypothetical protein